MPNTWVNIISYLYNMSYVIFVNYTNQLNTVLLALFVDILSHIDIFN